MRINLTKILNSFYLARQNSLEIFLNLWNYWYLRLYLIILLILNMLNWLFVYYINKTVSQNLIVLHYNVNLGVNLIGDVSRLFTLPGLGLIFIVANFILLMNIYKQGKIMIHLLLSAAILANIFLISATAAIFLVNFR